MSHVWQAELVARGVLRALLKISPVLFFSIELKITPVVAGEKLGIRRSRMSSGVAAVEVAVRAKLRRGCRGAGGRGGGGSWLQLGSGGLGGRRGGRG